MEKILRDGWQMWPNAMEILKILYQKTSNFYLYFYQELCSIIKNYQTPPTERPLLYCLWKYQRTLMRWDNMSLSKDCKYKWLKFFNSMHFFKTFWIRVYLICQFVWNVDHFNQTMAHYISTWKRSTK